MRAAGGRAPAGWLMAIASSHGPVDHRETRMITVAQLTFPFL